MPRGYFPAATACLLVLALAPAPVAGAQQPDVQAIIEKSVEANQADSKASACFDYKELDTVGNGSRTYQVTTIEGTPYERLIAVDDKPLPKDRQEQELRKQEQVTAQRKADSPQQKRARIAKWEKEQQRDNEMITQLTKAFHFTAAGQHNVSGFEVWLLKATPRPGYSPPNRNARVLTGMQGELWIDQATCQWVKVTAHVIHPVSIEGFLARVEPGTQFELDKSPVDGGTWQATHFSMRAHAKVLGFVKHSSSEDTTYYDYHLTSKNCGTK
ncbi:MAG: hypothetical protein JOY54_14595 [Acidobacteriaceae bacterium]|nr:hypothetical protein [Acidobacteriaceae bacterium]